jgi:hypothetical protein
MEESFDKGVRLSEILPNRPDFMRHILQELSLRPKQILACFEMIILPKQAPTSSRALLEHRRQAQPEFRLQAL